MLEVKNIDFRYPSEHYLFQNVHLTIAPGEVVGLYGKSGSGKTSLAKIIAGHLKPNKGSVKIDGHTISENQINPIQLIVQHPEKAINPRWRMKKVLEENGSISNSLLKELGIRKEWEKRYAGQLSGGELQRFCLARALSKHTKYIIADEITTMLDAITQAQIWKILLRVVKERQLGMLVISHELPLLNQICNRIIKFEDLSSRDEDEKIDS